MKKYAICILAVVIAITTSAFTAPKKENPGVYKWFDFNGGLLEMGDPGYYSLDPDQFPECTTVLGIIYCEIKAIPSEYDDTVPDLSTICATRFRPLL